LNSSRANSIVCCTNHLLFFLKDRANNNNANTSAEELDEELGDFELPLALTPRVSFTVSHNAPSTNVTQQQQQQSSSASSIVPSSLQHNVVFHSNVNEPLLPAINRLDLNLPLDNDNRNQLNRKANSLMTVFEHGSTHETMLGELSSSFKSESWRARSPSSIGNLTYQTSPNVPKSEEDTDEPEKVKEKMLLLLIVEFLF
jgi:hypothetical protein